MMSLVRLLKMALGTLFHGPGILMLFDVCGCLSISTGPMALWKDTRKIPLRGFKKSLQAMEKIWHYKQTIISVY